MLPQRYMVLIFVIFLVTWDTICHIIVLKVVIVNQVFQVAPSLHMVEVRKAKGDTLEFHKVFLLPPPFLLNCFTLSLIPIVNIMCWIGRGALVLVIFCQYQKNKT